MKVISVVICVKNGEKTIERVLKSLKHDQIMEIIIIDGNSKDNTIDIAKKYTNIIYSDNGEGLAYARQLGAQMARGEFVAYVDADTELSDIDIFSIMLRELKKNGWIAIHAQLTDPRKNKTYWETGENFHRDVIFNNAIEKRYIDTIVCIIKREIIIRNKFDPYFKGAAEDRDFFHRVRKNGYRFGISTSMAYHYHRSYITDFIKQRIWYGKGNAYLLWKYKNMILLLSPLLITFGGIYYCFRHRKIGLVFFYLVWGLSLSIGILIGLYQNLKYSYMDNEKI